MVRGRFAECVVDPLDGGALVVVPGVLIDAHHADAVVAGDGTDVQPPLPSEAPQLGAQRFLGVAVGWRAFGFCPVWVRRHPPFPSNLPLDSLDIAALGLMPRQSPQ